MATGNGQKIMSTIQQEAQLRKNQELDKFILQWARSEDKGKWVEFGAYVRKKREQKGVSRAELAEMLEVSEATLAAIENGLC